MALPGQTFTNGVSNYIFGTNTPNYDTSLLTDTQIQTQMASAGVTVIRTALGPPTGNYSDSQIDALATAISNAGAKMLAILPHNQSAFAQHVVSYLGSRCLLYEYSNERDINGESWQTYLSEWNSIIPLCRAANTSAAFIGPVLGVFGNVNSYLVPWLQGCKASGVLPDAVSVHIYPCTGNPVPQQTCALRAPGIGASVATLRSTVQGILGYNLPLCLTEWNADAYYANSPSQAGSPGQGYNSNAAANNSFNHQFVVDALEGFVANGLDMACHFELDYFMANKNGATSTAAQYTAMASEIAKYLGSGSTSVATVSVSPSSLSFAAPVNGSSSNQSLTVRNTGVSSGAFTSPITYSAYGNLNWVSVSAASTTIAAGGSQTVQVTCGPQAGMPVGSYTATITFTMGTSTATVTVTLTISAAAAASSYIWVPTNAYPTDPSGTGTTWAQYAAGSPSVFLLVANPASGPGSSADANFTTGIATMQAAGIQVLGYVNSSSNGALIPSATMKSQIDTWYTLYGIDGIYLDAALTTATNVPYYQGLHDYIETKDAIRNYVMLNANQVPPESYMNASDTVVVYQDTLGNIGRFVSQSYMANYPSIKFAAMVTGVTTTTVVDSTLVALQAANVGFVFVTDQTTAALTTPPGSTVWTELIKKSNVGGSTSSGGSSGATSALSLYLTGTAASTVTTANQLYAPTGAGSPTTTYHYSRVGTATGYGEVTSQGTTGAWAASGSIGSPTGNGFLYDVTALEGQQIVSGNWSATLRLNCAQNGDAAPQAGSLTADIVVRAYKRSSSGTYTPIVSMTLAAQTVSYAYTTFTLPATPASAMSFASGDKLYLDLWLNVTANTNASSVQDVRLNRESTDSSGHTGDANAVIGSPGTASATGTGGTGTTSATDTFVRANQSGFGTASDGESWTATGSGTLSIASNEGVIVSLASDTSVQLGTNTLADVDLRCRIAIGLGNDICGIQGRYSVSGGNVTCYKLVWAAGTLLLNKSVAGSNSTITSTAFVMTPGTYYQFHLRLQGTALYGSVYADGSTEPSTFLLTGTDSSVTGAGGIALLGNTTTGSTGVKYDHFTAAAVAATVTTPALTTTPTQLVYNAVQGSGKTASQAVTLTTNSVTSGTWTAAATYANGYGWIATNLSTGTLATSGTVAVDVAANTAGLTPGIYTAQLIFTVGTASQVVAITLILTASGQGTLPLLLTSAGKQLIFSALSGADNTAIQYIALGTGTATPQSGDVQLGNEIFRKPITAFIPASASSTGQLLVQAYIAPNEVVGTTIQEVGLFGGNAASQNANSGVLLARGLVLIPSKSNLQALQLQFGLGIQ